MSRTIAEIKHGRWTIRAYEVKYGGCTEVVYGVWNHGVYVTNCRFPAEVGRLGSALVKGIQGEWTRIHAELYAKRESESKPCQK